MKFCRRILLLRASHSFTSGSYKRKQLKTIFFTESFFIASRHKIRYSYYTKIRIISMQSWQRTRISENKICQSWKLVFIVWMSGSMQSRTLCDTTFHNIGHERKVLQNFCRQYVRERLIFAIILFPTSNPE